MKRIALNGLALGIALLAVIGWPGANAGAGVINWEARPASTSAPSSVPNVDVLDLANFDIPGLEGGFHAGQYDYLLVSYRVGVGAKLVRIEHDNFTAAGTRVSGLPAAWNLVQLDGWLYRQQPICLSASKLPAGQGAAAGISGNFTLDGVTILDLTTVDATLKGYQGGFAVGPYVYFGPGYNGAVVQRESGAG